MSLLENSAEFRAATRFKDSGTAAKAATELVTEVPQNSEPPLQSPQTDEVLTGSTMEQLQAALGCTQDWTLQTALAYVETLDESSMEDVQVVALLAQAERDLTAPDSELFLKALSRKTRLTKKDIVRRFFECRKLDTSSRYIADTLEGFPFLRLVVPQGYALRVNEATGLPEIVTYSNRDLVVVAEAAVFPVRVFLPKAKATLDHPELYQLVRYNPGTEAWEEVPQVFKKSYLCYTGSIHHLADTGVSVGSANSGELAKFFQTFINVNAKNMDRVETVAQFGWVTNKETGEKTFAPFNGSYTVVPASGDLTEKDEVAGNFEQIKEVAGSRSEAVAMVQEFKGNLVFLTTLAGVLTGPVVHLIRAHLQEGIGIDISGKTSKGKTSIQKIAFNLVYGDSTSFVRSWDGATPNGIWGIASLANHLPFILDDSHHIRKLTANTPHALINGAQGDKMQVNKATNELSLRDRKTVMTVILYNGEVQLSEQTLISNSRGLLGRVIMIIAPPFPATYTSEQVKASVRRSHANRGQFRDEWLGHLAKLDSDAIIDEVVELTKLFTVSDQSSLYGRLATKAAALYWSLNEANKVLGLGINTAPLVPFLIQHMTSTSTNADIIEEIVIDIVERVIQNSGPGESFHPITQNRSREGYNAEEDDFFLIKKDALVKILDGRRKVEPFLDELVREGYIPSKKSVRKTVNNEIGLPSSTSGYLFPKKIISAKLGIDVDIVGGEAACTEPVAALAEDKKGFEKAKVLNRKFRHTAVIKASRKGVRYGGKK